MTEEFIIELAVTSVCEKGCKHAYSCIDKLKNNDTISETQKLSNNQSQKVLVELETIMSIYDGEVCSAN